MSLLKQNNVMGVKQAAEKSEALVRKPIRGPGGPKQGVAIPGRNLQGPTRKQRVKACTRGRSRREKRKKGDGRGKARRGEERGQRGREGEETLRNKTNVNAKTPATSDTKDIAARINKTATRDVRHKVTRITDTSARAEIVGS